MKYIILLVVATLVFPILIYIGRRKSIGSWIIPGTVAGLFISIMGLVMQETFNPLVVLLVMFGLAFAVAVLLDKRSEQDRAVKFKKRPEKERVPTTVESYQDSGLREMAVALEEDEFTIKPIEDDLNRWMTANRDEIDSHQSEVHDRQERPDGE